MGHIKPEAVHFGAENGRRACSLVFDMKDGSEPPSAAEPFFSDLGADAGAFPVMDQDDPHKGLAQVR